MPCPTSAEMINPNKKNSKPPVPYAITSEQWRNIQEEKETEKKEKEEAIKKRREIRIQKQKLAEEKQIAANEKESNDNDSTSDSESEPVVPPKKFKKNTNYILCDYKVGDYVIIEYEKEYFPGIIRKVKKKIQMYEISAMVMVEAEWKWPEIKDVLWYPTSSIIQKIEQPSLVNAEEKIFCVPEITELRKTK